MTGREKWLRFLAGEDMGTMVSPLCDKWGTDRPYQWTLPEPEPFPKGTANDMLSQQIMMAETFHWDPLFLASLDFCPRNGPIPSRQQREKISDTITRITTTISTPYGNLTQIMDENNQTLCLVKDFLTEEEDFSRMLWLTEQQMDIEEDAVLEQGEKIRKAVADRGLIGTWVGTSAMMADISVLFFLETDFPEAFEELFEAKKKLLRKQLSLYRKAGFDYLFYVIPGTEWISPAFFERWLAEEIAENIQSWRESGGYTLWHTCGLEKAFMERGFYNRLKPDIFETLSEPPVGNLPSLKWGREQLDPAIITKGNISLDLMLNGTPEQIREQVRYVKDSTQGYRHIIGLSDNILDNTPYENLIAFVEEARL